MPWITDDKGEIRYNVSPYIKEDLPTWSELREFYEGEVFSYNPDEEHSQGLDQYWKIPRRKFLVAVCCNELNKLIQETTYITEDVLNWLHKFINGKVTDIRYLCEPIIPFQNTVEELVIQKPEFHDSAVSNPNTTIYTLHHPLGHKNPFLDISKAPRKYVDDITTEMILYPVVQFEKDGTTFCWITMPGMNPNNRYHQLMNIVLKDVQGYFNGAFVGWKEGEDHTISTEADKFRPISINGVPDCTGGKFNA